MENVMSTMEKRMIELSGGQAVSTREMFDKIGIPAAPADGSSGHGTSTPVVEAPALKTLPELA